MRETQYDTLMEARPDGTQIWVSAAPETDVSIAEEAKNVGGGSHGRSFAKTVRRMVADWGTWGWCTVTVRAIRGDVEGCAYLGCCCYKNAADFKAGGYYEQKVEEALKALEEEQEPVGPSEVLGLLTDGLDVGAGLAPG